jgi:hypothetical protein
METRPKTIFCDIDGTLVQHASPDISSKPSYKMILLEGTIEKLLEWDKAGYNIILTTGRKESLRAVTEKQLAEAGIFYNQLVMGIGGGERYLVNDCKENGAQYAKAINLSRNQGIKNLNI